MRPFVCLFLIVFGCLAVGGAESGTQSVAIVAKPQFKRDITDLVDLIISDTNRDYTFCFIDDKGTFPAMLDTNQFYTFMVASVPFRGRSIPQLSRVQFNGQTIYDVEVCEVHKTRMELKTVPIVYGLMMPDPDDPMGHWEHRLFPHGCNYALGGCVVESDSPKTDKIYVCAECEKAVAKWKADMQLKAADLRQKILNAPKPHAYKLGALDDGGTLSGVAKLFYGDARKWPAIYDANRSILKDPDKLTGNETLIIPKL